MEILDRLSVCVCVCCDAFEKMDVDSDENERREAFEDIKEFLMMTLTYFESMEEWKFVPRVIATNLRFLIESLCLLHALYGYPANSNTGNILIKAPFTRPNFH